MAEPDSSASDAAVVAPKKLIEVALPLDAINEASAKEKSIRHGHPSSLHRWWSRKPLSAARAVIFAQMVDDPSAHPDLFPTPAAVERERKRLFKIIRDLVQWKNTTSPEVIERARAEIWASWRRTCAANADHPRADELFDRHRLPPFCDPFAGGGSLPLEAQRLGLEAHASDLNPVAVMINKAMIEIPPKFADRPPVNPSARDDNRLTDETWFGAQGLANDVHYYGLQVRDEAARRIGHLYPKVAMTAEMAVERPDLAPYVGRELTVIAWLWARTVPSPNPAFTDVEVPLASTFVLSKKRGKETYVEPIIENGGYRFDVKVGTPPEAAKLGTSAGKRQAFRCLMSGIALGYDHIAQAGQDGRMGSRLMAIVVEGDRTRLYLPPLPEHELAAREAQPTWRPEIRLPERHRNFQTPKYGMPTVGDLFTDRQLVALTTLSDLIDEARAQVRNDAVVVGMAEDDVSLREGGSGARAYADSLSIYLSFVLGKQADLGNNLCRWEPVAQCPRQLLGQQAIPMMWDVAEGNPLCSSSGGWSVLVDGLCRALSKVFSMNLRMPLGRSEQSDGTQLDAAGQTAMLVSTDPPYFDSIGYADISDFYYAWLRRCLKDVYPEEFATVAVPKSAELVAISNRHNSVGDAREFFLAGMTRAMGLLHLRQHTAYPVTVYYAFKQTETKSDRGTARTGWANSTGGCE
ncbi:MAG: DUF1156 domain-containing protein [Acidimicrobiaceae bacterium]|nr:DUF1156 domain-containing protein [Acidimicrobiaceae bacterium]